MTSEKKDIVPPPPHAMGSLWSVGTDILEIDRFRQAMDQYKTKFLERLFTQSERAYCDKFKDPSANYAARFAAKEAVVKALGGGFGRHVGFLDIEILNAKSGRPCVILSEESARYYRYPTLLISLSHCKKYATATAILIHHEDPKQG